MKGQYCYLQSVQQRAYKNAENVLVQLLNKNVKCLKLN